MMAVALRWRDRGQRRRTETEDRDGPEGERMNTVEPAGGEASGRSV